MDKRLSDSDIEEFILCLKPVIFHMMFNEKFNYSIKPVFNILSTIRPDLVIPTLLEKFKSSILSLTESHSLKACLVTLKHCSRPLVENYPMEVIQILKDAGLVHRRLHPLPLLDLLLLGLVPEQNPVA